MINAKLSASAYPGATVTTGVYPNPVDSTNLLAKVDHQLNGRDQLTVRYSEYDVSSSNSRGAGGLSAPSASSALDNVDRSASFANTLSLSGSTVNETRAQVSFGDLKAPPSDLVGPAVSISGVAGFGTLSSSPTRRVNTFYEFIDNLSHQAGGHALRAGVDLLYNDDAITFPRSFRGSYTFSSLASFLAGTYNNAGFTQTFGPSVVSQTNPNVGVYVQDEWHTKSNLTINAGLRYDLQWLQTIATDTNNVAPRAGFAWSLGRSQRTVIRGSAGLFYDRVPLRALANALLVAGNTADLNNLQQINVSLTPGQAAAPAFPNILASIVPSVTLANFTTMDPHLQNAYSRQASAEIERQLGASTTVSIGYQYVRGLDLLMQVNQNVPTCLAAGTNNGCRPVAAYANNSQYSAAGDSTYHGLHVSLVQRPGKWGYYRVTYTLSKAMDDVGRVLLQFADRSRRRLERLGTIRRRPAPSPVLNGAVNLPRGVSDERHVPVLLGASVQHHLWRDHAAGKCRPSACERSSVVVVRAAGRAHERVHRAQFRAGARLPQHQREADQIV